MKLHVRAILGFVCLSLAAADVRDIAGQRFQQDSGNFASSSNTLAGQSQAPLVVAAFSSNNNGKLSGGTFVANNGQIVKQTFNPNGGATYSSKTYNSGNVENTSNHKRYWWMDTKASPFRKQNTFAGESDISPNSYSHGCLSLGCSASGSLNIKHTQNTQHVKRQDYGHNPFLNDANLAVVPLASNNVYTQTHISGSASDVNNLLAVSASQAKPFSSNSFTSNTLTSGKLVQPLSGASHNGYIPPAQSQKIPCSGNQQICAPQELCNNGYISENQLGLILSRTQVSYAKCQLIPLKWFNYIS